MVGAGPAGLMAAEILAGRGHAVTVYDRMASPARKLLMAGRGGLNLTHSEPLDALLARYVCGRPALEPAIRAFTPEALRAWSGSLGQETFVGSSGRVFPRSMKASPLLRAWLHRLVTSGVRLALRHRWVGWNDQNALLFDAGGGPIAVEPDATLFALGGASWPRLGADGGWVEPFRRRGIPIEPLRASNAGVLIDWSPMFRERFAGVPLKRIRATAGGRSVRGEALVTATGLEGGAIYGLAPVLAAGGALRLDLRPDLETEVLVQRLARADRKHSLANRLRQKSGLGPAAIGLLREATGNRLPTGPEALARLIKDVILPVTGLASLERAISTAGGVSFTALDARFMLRDMPGCFVAGEMLDWDAPTGGYLLQACFATAVAAANGLDAWLAMQPLHA